MEAMTKIWAWVPGRLEAVTYLKEGKCAYSGMTRAELEAQNPGVMFTPWEAMLINFDAVIASLQTPWKEISEEDYDAAIGELPPERMGTFHGVQVFRSPEAYAHTLKQHYAATSGKFYTALRVPTPMDAIALSVKKLV